MNYRWKTPKARLAVCISLVSLLILMSVNDTQPARAQTTLPSFTLVNNAVLLEDRLRLTIDQPDQIGAAWLPTKQPVQGGFDATFQWQISRTVDPRRGADGFAFVIHNANLPFPGLALGDGGSGMGFTGIPNSLAVEFDTAQNLPGDFIDGTKGDHNDNHISVQTRGTLPNSADTDFSLGFTTQGTPAIPLFADGSVHTTKVAYKPGTLTIFLDDMAKPLLTVSVDLGTTLSLDNRQAWVGFTAATGRRAQAHDIHSFSFANVGTEVAQPSVDIDIIPGSDPNSWSCQNTEEDLPVAILSTDTFDATAIVPSSVRFGKTGTEPSEVHTVAVKDVNGDGHDEFVFRFRFGDTVFSCDDIPEGQESVVLTAKLTGEAKGKPIAGEGSLQLVRQ
jgi:Bacterial lectin